MTLTSPHEILINTLRGKIESVLEKLIPDGNRPFALLDFPNHDNIGDSAIYLGEICYLKSRKMKPAFVSTVEKFDSEKMSALIGEGPIYLHGGGNFGDLWPWFQNFREHILEKYQGREIIQMPQTLHFSSQQKIDQTARLIERHGNLKLLVRDHRSYKQAQKSFQCEVYLCPDMAFCIPPAHRQAERSELLLHLRKDQEASEAHNTEDLLKHSSVVREDWPHENKISKLGLFSKSLGRALIAGASPFNREVLRSEFYLQLATCRFNRGISLLSSAKVVITDRLHGHIMSVLAGIPHCVLDNSYGKTSSFMEAWGTQIEHVYFASSVKEAVEILAEKEGLRLT